MLRLRYVVEQHQAQLENVTQNFGASFQGNHFEVNRLSQKAENNSIADILRAQMSLKPTINTLRWQGRQT
jgi:hypothetical protein